VVKAAQLSAARRDNKINILIGAALQSAAF
jgi:hypothetical protein